MQIEHQEQTHDLLTGYENNIVRASAGKRLANYIIDLAVFYLLVAIIAFTFALINPAAVDDWADDSGINILERLLYTLLYGIYMFIVEALFKGKSLGKLITGTRAVNLDGSRITTTTALGRGLSRAVPFNELSALGSTSNPWHDKWNKTMVMDEKRSTYNNEIE